MNRNETARSPGIIGCFDPSGSIRPKLESWCASHGAVDLVGEGMLGLWSSTPGHSAVHPIRGTGLAGVLIGNVFSSSSEQAAGQSPPTPSARLAAAYRGGGPSCLFTLDGQFSLVLWDAQRRELLLHRDGSATRSLFFSRIGSNGLVFCDDLDLLVRSPLVEKRLSRRSIHEFLRFLDISPPNTIYEGVTCVEPNVLYRMGSDLIREEPEDAPSGDPPPASLDDAAEELERLLAAAVAARMDAQGTTVTFLSGGVDSSLVCALASRYAPNRVHAVTVGFEETEFDESHVARRVAEHLGVPHEVLAFPMTAYRNAFEELTAQIQYPSADPAGVPTLLAFRKAAGIGSCALDGTGADTLFGVMPARHQRLAVELGTLLPRPLRHLATRVMKITPGLAGYTPLLDFDDPEEVLIRWRGWSRTALERLCREPVSLDHTRFYRLFRTFPRNAHLERYSALLGNLPDDRIHQAAELTGIDVRFPYVDPAITEWVKHLGIDLRYHTEEPKRVLKAALARHVPRPLWDVPKHGFDFPFLQLMRADGCALVRTYLDPALTEPWDLFDAKEVQDVRQALMCSDRCSAFSAASPAFRTWALVVLFAWLEHHFRDL